MANVAWVVFDNPILTKHARTRLRLGQTLPWVVVVAALSVFASWAGREVPDFDDETAVMGILGLQAILLIFIGAHQITSSLGSAKESGMLDFHRISPLPPGVTALGFFLGAPIREYLLAAITIPCALFSAYNSDEFAPSSGVIQLAKFEAALLLTAWIAHAFAMLGCLVRKKPRGSAVGTVVLVILLIPIGYSAMAVLYFGATLLRNEPELNFFGLMVPWLPWLVLYEAAALGFLALAISRKMQADRTHAYTKPQALACMATATVFTLGGFWKIGQFLSPAYTYDRFTDSDTVMMGSIYGLAIMAMILAVTITPDLSEYVKGLRRAGRQGLRRLGPFSDASSNRVAVFGLCTLLLVGASAIVSTVGKPPAMARTPGINLPFTESVNVDDEAWSASRRSRFARPITVAVLTVASVGLGFQYFSLRTRRSGLTMMGFFLFMTWIGPLLLGAIVSLEGPSHQALQLTILALSPVFGTALSASPHEIPGIEGIQGAALVPPIAFAFLFNYLLIATQRKIDRLLRSDKLGDTEVKPADTATSTHN
jgi:hypothetical protein